MLRRCAALLTLGLALAATGCSKGVLEDIQIDFKQSSDGIELYMQTEVPCPRVIEKLKVTANGAPMRVGEQKLEIGICRVSYLADKPKAPGTVVYELKEGSRTAVVEWTYYDESKADPLGTDVIELTSPKSLDALDNDTVLTFRLKLPLAWSKKAERVCEANMLLGGGARREYDCETNAAGFELRPRLPPPDAQDKSRQPGRAITIIGVFDTIKRCEGLRRGCNGVGTFSAHLPARYK